MEIYGVTWLETTLKLVLEDKAENLRWQMMMAPLHQTAQTKDGARQLNSHSRKVSRLIEGLTPWSKSAHQQRFKRATKESGSQIVVMLDANDDPNNPLFKDATIG